MIKDSKEFSKKTKYKVKKLQEIKPILEFFKDQENNEIEIVFIIDIDYSEYPYYYNVVVKDIKSNFFMITKISPELLRYRYKVGYVYKNNKAIGKNKFIQKETFTIDTTNDLKLFQLKDILQPNDKKIINYEVYEKYLLKQYCYKIELLDCILIIPCYTIANRFYFLSSSMKRAVFNSSFTSLCYEEEFKKEDGEVYLYAKHSAAKRDYPYICRFLENNYAFNKLKYFFYQKSNLKKGFKYGQIRALFPVQSSFEIDTSYIKINTDNKKPTLLITEICNDNSPLNFSKIYVKKYLTKTSTFGTTGIDIPGTNTFRKKRPKKINPIIKEGTPSSSYITNFDNDIVEKDRNTDNITIETENIYKESNAKLETEYTDNIVNCTFNDASSDGSKDLIQTYYSFFGEGENKEKNIFNINDFYMLYECLSQELGVVSYSISDLIPIKSKTNKSGNISTKYYLMSSQARNFIYADFEYNNKYIFIIEIELDPIYPSLSTWFFISKDEEFNIQENICQDIISHYIGECSNYQELRKYIKDEYDLEFYNKAHIKKIYDDSLIISWVETVLEDLKSF